MSSIRNILILAVLAVLVALPAGACPFSDEALQRMGSAKPNDARPDHEHQAAQRADAPLDCSVRGKMVEMMVYSVSTGVKLETINFDYNGQVLTKNEAAFVESVRAEVSTLLAGQTPPAGDAIYAGLLGAQSETYCTDQVNRVLEQLRNAAEPAPAPQEPPMVEAASSERLMVELYERRKASCREKLSDDSMIVRYHLRGITQEVMTAHAAQAKDLVDDPPRMAATLKSIADAHKFEGGPRAWYNSLWEACMATPDTTPASESGT